MIVPQYMGQTLPLAVETDTVNEQTILFLLMNFSKKINK